MSFTALSQFAIIEQTEATLFRKASIDSLRLFSFANPATTQTDNYIIGADGNDGNYPRSTQRAFSAEFSTSAEYGVSLDSTPQFWPDELGQQYVDAELTAGNAEYEAANLQYRNYRLLFAQGFALDSSTPALMFRAYVQLSSGARVYLASLVIKNTDAILRPSTIPLTISTVDYNTEISLQLIDLDYVLNSQADDEFIRYLRSSIFNNEKPQTIIFEFATLSPGSIQDNIPPGGAGTYETFVVGAFSSSQLEFAGNDLKADVDIVVTNRNKYIDIQFQHEKYDVEAYMNRIKGSAEEFNVYYDVNIGVKTGSAIQFQSQYRLSNTNNKFGPISFRPVVSFVGGEDAIVLIIDGYIENSTTTERVSRRLQYVITQDMHAYDPRTTIADFAFENQVKVINKITKQVKQVTIPTDTPDVIRITKPVYVFTQQANELLLIDRAFAASLSLPDVNLSNTEFTYLQIGSNKYRSLSGNKLTFKLSQSAYASKATRFYLLTPDDETIAYGSIIRD